MRDGVIDVDVATPASRGFFGIQFRIADDGANAEWVYLRQHKSGASRRDAVHAGPQHRPQLADLQRAGLHRRGRHPEGRLVPPAPRGDRRAGEALRQGHGQAGARDERPEERRPEGPGGPVRPDGRDLLLELRSADDARRALGAAPAADAAGHADEVEPVAVLRRARAQPRSVRSRPSESDAMRGRTSRRSRPASSSSTAIARARIRASRSRTTSRSASSPSRE